MQRERVMDVASVRIEQTTIHPVKLEGSTQHLETAVSMDNFQDYDSAEGNYVTGTNISNITKQYVVDSDEGAQILGNDNYTYIIGSENEGESTYGLDDSTRFIIEEYQGDYDEREVPQYETVYIQSVEESDEGMEEPEYYTIHEEVQSEDASDNANEEHLSIIVEGEDNSETTNECAMTAVTPDVHFIVKQEFGTENAEEEDDEDEEQIDQPPECDNSDNSQVLYVYECSLCLKRFKTSSAVKRHVSVRHSDESQEKQTSDKDVLAFSLCPCCGEPSDSAHTTGDFNCDLCGKLFIQQNSLDRHKSIEHPSGDNYVCCDCQKQFPTKELLIDHNRVHSLKAMVKCQNCGRDFARKYHLERHLMQTGCMGLPKQVFECRVCNKTFTRRDNLGEHLKAHAGLLNKRKKTISCEFCQKEFSGSALLQIHIRTHTGERPYDCDICEKKFPSSGAMKKHRRKHTGEKPYSCPQCGARFAAKETLNRHWRTHTGDKPHECQYCGKAFIQAAQLRAHVFHHTGENAYTCPHCGRAFNRKLRLTTHIKFIHQGAEPLPCPYRGCSKTFFRKEDIQRHVVTHSGEKPFKCDVCDKRFPIKSSLKMHQNVHKVEQPVSCETCGRAFIRKDCLMRHMRARHRDVLEDIMANAETKRLKSKLLLGSSSAEQKKALQDTIVWTELTLSESVKELLGLLVDEDYLALFGYPDAPVDKVLESVIKKCGHTPALESDFDYIGRMRENAKLLFTVVIDDRPVKDLLKNKSVDEVILHVLRLARKQQEEEEEEEEDEEEEEGEKEDEEDEEEKERAGRKGDDDGELVHIKQEQLVGEEEERNEGGSSWNSEEEDENAAEGAVDGGAYQVRLKSFETPTDEMDEGPNVLANQDSMDVD